MELQEMTLSNGLPVLIVPAANPDVCAAIFLTRAGSRFETPEANGLSRFTALMSMKVTQDFQTLMDLSTALDKTGTHLNFEVSREYSAFYVKSSTQSFAKALHILSQITVYPVFRPDDISSEKQLFLQEIQGREKDPNLLAQDTLFSLVFGANALGFSGVGDKNAVETFTLAMIQNYKDQFYTAHNSLLVLCVSEDVPVQTLEGLFGELKPGARLGFEPIGEGEVLTKMKTIPSTLQTTSLAFCFPAYPRGSKEKYAQLMLDIMFGKMRSNARLQDVYRKERAIQSLSSNIYQFSDTGLFVVQLTATNEKIKQAYEMVLDEITKLVHEPVTEEELEKAKGYYRGMLTLDLNDPVERGLFFGFENLLEEKVPSVEEFTKNLDAVTVEDIAALSHTIFQEEKLFAVRVGGGQ